MQTQTYYHTKLETDANRSDETVPLQVNCVGAVSQKERFFNHSVRRDFYYIYVLKGKMIMEAETLEAGDVIVFEPGQRYRYESEGETEYLWVHYTGFDARHVTASALRRADSDIFAARAVFGFNEKMQIGLHREILECFEKLFREFIINDEASRTICVCVLREILALTGRYAGARNGEDRPFASIEHIHRFFREEIGVESLAEMENKSCTAFRSAFKAHTGVSPNEYIIMQRIGEACRLLSQTESSVCEIAKEVGYEDPYYFSRIFKKKVGSAPLAWRRQHKL